MNTSPIMAALASAFQIASKSSHRIAAPCQSAMRQGSMASQKAPFSTSSTRQARKKGVSKPDRRVTLIRYHLYHPTTLMPRPLRFSRTRALRHWTIHRAWQLFRHKSKEKRQLELERQWNAMNAACEELRVGSGDGGRLFRKAMMKTGIWGHGGVPIEYSRGMMDWVGSAGVGAGASGGKARIWNHNWKRS